jgi:putative NADH-flavin reductase
MAKISVFGGTGYAGNHIVREAAGRGHTVTSYSRNVAEQQVDGVTYETGSVLDPAIRARALAGADVVVLSIPPRGEMADRLQPTAAALAEEAALTGVRLAVVGGAGSLLTTEGGPRLVDTPEFPEAFTGEVLLLAGVLDQLRSSAPADLDWFFLSPAVTFGSHNPGEATGRYRIGGDVVVSDGNGLSAISGADYALALVDEIETPAHSRARFTVAY